jgi:hypothetical protein
MKHLKPPPSFTTNSLVRCGLHVELVPPELLRSESLCPALFEPFFRFRHGTTFFRILQFIVNRCVDNGTRDGIKHQLGQVNNRRQLVRRQPLNQLVGLLLVVFVPVRHCPQLMIIGSTLDTPPPAPVD